jgi:hypothetical protein
MTDPTWSCPTVSGLGDGLTHLSHPVIPSRAYCGLPTLAGEPGGRDHHCIPCGFACRRAESILAEHPDAGVIDAVRLRACAMAMLDAAGALDPEPAGVTDEEYHVAVAVSACAARDAVNAAITDPTTTGAAP